VRCGVGPACFPPRCTDEGVAGPPVCVCVPSCLHVHLCLHVNVNVCAMPAYLRYTRIHTQTAWPAASLPPHLPSVWVWVWGWGGNRLLPPPCGVCLSVGVPFCLVVVCPLVLWCVCCGLSLLCVLLIVCLTETVARKQNRMLVPSSPLGRSLSHTHT